MARCKDCGFRIRGNNHYEGQHHNLSKKANKRSFSTRPIRIAPVGKK